MQTQKNKPGDLCSITGNLGHPKESKKILVTIQKGQNKETKMTPYDTFF